jgi:hypothetical protein
VDHVKDVSRDAIMQGYCERVGVGQYFPCVLSATTTAVTKSLDKKETTFDSTDDKIRRMKFEVSLYFPQLTKDEKSLAYITITKLHENKC